MKTRTEYIGTNLIANIIKYVTNLLLQFVVRTVLIYTMGAEYLGLNGLFTNIFAFINNIIIIITTLFMMTTFN